MFSHEKLHVYGRSIEWLALSCEIINDLPKGSADLANQLRRASLSIPLNIAEGAGKTSPLDKRRFYGIARGSSFECAAILDAIKVLRLIQESKIEAAKKPLEEVAAMLSSLCIKWGKKGD